MKKAQAAMEFLMTYGWAILIVLIAIGALAYYGTLNPSKFLPEKCVFPPGIDCREFAVSTNELDLVLQNSLGEDITITEVTTDIGYCTDTTETDVKNGDLAYYYITCSNAGRAGTMFKAEINVTYTGEQGIEHTKIGEIVKRID